MKAKLEEWRKLSEQLKDVKKREMELRRDIFDNICEGHEFKNSRRTIKVHVDGFDIKAAQGMAYKVDPRVAELWTDLTKEEKACIDWKPSLKMKNWHALDEDSHRGLDFVVTSTLSAPTMTAELPYKGD